MPISAPKLDAIPSQLTSPSALRFWLVVVLTGIGTGLGAVGLTLLLMKVQQVAWGGTGSELLLMVQRASPSRRIFVVLSAGILTGAGQMLLQKLSGGRGIDVTAAIWFQAGRVPALRTLGSAVLSIFVVGMGASLGREGAPKQAGTVIANFFCDRARLSDEQRRLLVACAAGAGMGAAYGVPLGGALFSIEVVRGLLALRFVLPALCMSLVASGVWWIFMPDAPTYLIPAYSSSAPVLLWVLIAGPIVGIASVWYVRLVVWAERHKPTRWQRLIVPAIVFGAMGVTSIWFPQILGNGKDISQLVFTDTPAAALVLILMFLKPAATILCIRSGTPGGLFTPSLTAGALLGAVLGYGWSAVWPGVPIGLYAFLGAAAVLAATTQGPVSAVVLMMELTGHDRSFILPLLMVVCLATLISRTIEPRSIYDARLSDAEVGARQRARDLAAVDPLKR